jgi:hypothetical protein
MQASMVRCGSTIRTSTRIQAPNVSKMGGGGGGVGSFLPSVILGAGSEPAKAARSSASRSTCCVSASRADTLLPLSSPAAEQRSRTSPARPAPRLRPRIGAGHGGPWNRKEETWRKPRRRRPVLRKAVAIGQRVEETSGET